MTAETLQTPQVLAALVAVLGSLLTAVVARLQSRRDERLRSAVDLRDRIPSQMRSEWDLMIIRDVRKTIRSSRGRRNHPWISGVAAATLAAGMYSEVTIAVIAGVVAYLGHGFSTELRDSTDEWIQEESSATRSGAERKRRERALGEWRFSLNLGATSLGLVVLVVAVYFLDSTEEYSLRSTIVALAIMSAIPMVALWYTLRQLKRGGVLEGLEGADLPMIIDLALAVSTALKGIGPSAADDAGGSDRRVSESRGSAGVSTTGAYSSTDGD